MTNVSAVCSESPERKKGRGPTLVVEKYIITWSLNTNIIWAMNAYEGSRGHHHLANILPNCHQRKNAGSIQTYYAYKCYGDKIVEDINVELVKVMPRIIQKIQKVASLQYKVSKTVRLKCPLPKSCTAARKNHERSGKDYTKRNRIHRECNEQDLSSSQENPCQRKNGLSAKQSWRRSR